MSNHKSALKFLLTCLLVSLTACSTQIVPPGTNAPEPTKIAAGTSIPKPTTTSTPSTAFPLAGVWTGSAKNGAIEMQVTITMEATCQVGQMCGLFDLHNVPCAGTYTLVGEENNIYEFKAGNFQGSCGVGRDFLQLLPNGSLQYTSRGDYGETLGNLTLNNAPLSPIPEVKKMAVIFDDDGSPDGTTALLYLLSNPGASVRAVTISHGEAHPQIYIQHMGRMIDNFGIKGIPLGAGQDGPLSGNNEFPEWLRQSANNFWGLSLPNAQKTYPVQDAAQLMVSILKQAVEPITIFVSGPCTDLARALKIDPNIQKNINSVFIMGGAIYTPGNLSDLLPNPANKVAEWNIYADPQAAEEVFTSGLDIFLVPLDATNQVKITMADTQQWRSGGKIAYFTADIYDMLLKSSNKPNVAIWDLMTSEIMVKPDLCGFQPLHLDVNTKTGDTSGQTIVLPTGKPNINVCLKPNAGLIKQTLVDIFSNSR
jgi:pyrimidine-specific ribonucleoside hydrolase